MEKSYFTCELDEMEVIVKEGANIIFLREESLVLIEK